MGIEKAGPSFILINPNTTATYYREGAGKSIFNIKNGDSLTLLIGFKSTMETFGDGWTGQAAILPENSGTTSGPIIDLVVTGDKLQYMQFVLTPTVSASLLPGTYKLVGKLLKENFSNELDMGFISVSKTEFPTPGTDL